MKNLEQTVWILTEQIEEMKSRITELEKENSKQQKETKHIFQELSIKSEWMIEKFEKIVSSVSSIETIIEKIKKILHL